MKIGLVKANFPGERRVPLLPKDIKDFKNEILVEEGFGKFLDIDDQEYIDKGCHIQKLDKIYLTSFNIFSCIFKKIRNEVFFLTRYNNELFL